MVITCNTAINRIADTPSESLQAKLHRHSLAHIVIPSKEGIQKRLLCDLVTVKSEAVSGFPTTRE